MIGVWGGRKMHGRQSMAATGVVPEAEWQGSLGHLSAAERRMIAGLDFRQADWPGVAWYGHKRDEGWGGFGCIQAEIDA